MDLKREINYWKKLSNESKSRDNVELELERQLKKTEKEKNREIKRLEAELTFIRKQPTKLPSRPESSSESSQTDLYFQDPKGIRLCNTPLFRKN